MNKEPRPTTRNRQRFGMTLIELILVIATVGMLATITARLLHAVIRQQSASTMQLSLNDTLLRIEQRLRKDAHAAVDVEVYLNSMLQLTLVDGQRVEWTRKDDWLVRSEDGKQVSVEHFDLLPELSHSFELKTLEDSHSLSKCVVFELQPKRSNKDGESVARDSRFTTFRGGAKIWAVVGHDLRFARETQP